MHMIEQTHLDQLVNFPDLVIRKMLESHNVVDLLANKIGATSEDLENDDGSWKCFFDYEYIPGTIQEVLCAVCTDADIASVQNGEIKTLELYISVLCSQSMMKLDKKIFTGWVGNRMNNLIRYIDLQLRGNRDFGIGQLELKSVRTVASGNINFAKKQIMYQIPDFNIKRAVLK